MSRYFIPISLAVLFSFGSREVLFWFLSSMEFCNKKNSSTDEVDDSVTGAKTSEEKKESKELQSLFGISGKLWLAIFRCFVIIGCLVAVVVQLTECYQKLMKPPILTHTRFLVNDSLLYPALTFCREPPFRAEVFLKLVKPLDSFATLPLASLNIPKTSNFFFFYSIAKGTV